MSNDGVGIEFCIVLSFLFILSFCLSFVYSLCQYVGRAVWHSLLVSFPYVLRSGTKVVSLFVWVIQLCKIYVRRQSEDGKFPRDARLE